VLQPDRVIVLPANRLSLTVLLRALLLGALLLAGASHAEPTLDALRAAVARGGLDDAQREAANENLVAAERATQAAAELSAQLSALRAEIADQPARMAKLQARAAADAEQDAEQRVQKWAARLPAGADGETLERLLDQQRREAVDLQAQIEAAAAELASALSRPAQSAADSALLRRRVDELSVPVLARDGEAGTLFETRQLRSARELQLARLELELRVTEQDSAAQRQRLSELSLAELRQRLDLAQRRVALVQARIADLWRTDLQARLARLTAREAELAGAGQLVALTAAENRVIGDELAESHEHLARDRRTLTSIEEERDYVTEALRDSRTRLELGAANERVGQWLWSERRRLEPPARLRAQLDDTQVALAELRLRLVALTDQQQELVDIPRAVRALREAAEAGADDEQIDAGAQALLPPLLRDRLELLALLQPVLERRINALEQSERALRERLVATMALQALLDRHLLWLPSHGAVNTAWLSRVPAGLLDLVKPGRFVTTFQLCVRHLAEHPLRWLAGVALLAVLLVLRRIARVRIDVEERRAADMPSNGHGNSYAATGRILLWTVLGALPIPAAIAGAGVLLQQVGDPGRFSDSVGRALLAVVIPYLGIQILRWTVRDRGLADTYFGWGAPRRAVLRRWLPVAAMVVLPALFITELGLLRRADVAIDVTARLAVVVGSGMLAWTIWRLLAPGRLWTLQAGHREPSTARVLLRGFIAALLIGNVMLALAGYVYSAAVLLESALASVTLVIAVSLAMGMLARWFLVGERRLAQLRTEEQRRTAHAAARDAGEGTAEPAPEITLEQVGTQTASLLRALRVSLLALGLLWVWADVLPAIYRLDEIAVWHFTEAGADGVNVEQPVTLAAMLLGLFALAATVVGSRNLPGLVEISLLSRAGIDAASRYVITSLLRYTIVIGGTLVGLNFLGMRWSQLQWMAAALTVGLGFGLQEIFANFVSGIILLFERPFRVGDVITVGDMTGRVTRIRTRATTILDFDNKEIVMPNKTFITGHLTNWALSDSTTRVIIKVGVAYGTDPALVRKLLLQAAAEDRRVVSEPAPSSWFLAFGASSLDFELRVFVGTLADRLEAQNALNIRINELFAQHGIEIAFPQLDLHVRDVPPPAAAP
jgi:potassium efflux system protein